VNARTTITPRYPTFQLKDIEPRWSRNGEMAHSYNAAAMVPCQIEPYLVRVMLKALPLISAERPELREDVETFNKQEVEHAKQHIAFYKILREKGYPRLAEFDKQLATDYKRFLEAKSLQFNIAYSEGFEAMGSAGAETFFQVLPLLERGADQRAVDLWKWHLAEEFEHRRVCFDLYEALYGGGLFRGYFYRCYGFVYAYLHLTRYMNRIADYMIGKDRESMTAEQVEKSKARLKTYRRNLLKSNLKQALAVFSPFYNPSKKTAPVPMAEYLRSISAWERPA